MTLEFEEIVSAVRFEDLVAAYFEGMKHEEENNFIDVIVKPTGVGADGGRDILVDFKLRDGVKVFERRWVVQCKFLTANVSSCKISDINIPTLIHSYQASGYLLVCKQRPTSKLTALFERLSENCIHGYQYEIWSGEEFKRLILTKGNSVLLKQYFPRYFANTIKKLYF